MVVDSANTGTSTGSNSSFYDQVVSISQVYLGSTANRFIAGQVENHLHKSPQELSQNDLLNLIDWIRTAVCFLTEDGKLIEEYTSELRKLSGQNNKPLSI